MINIADELYNIMYKDNCSPILALQKIKETDYEYVRKQYNNTYDEQPDDASNADK